MQITVPPVPEGLHPAGCWRRLLTGIDPQAKGGYRVKGTHVYAGDVLDVPEGSLLVVVDKATRGWEDDYRGYGRHAVEDATVTVYLAAAGTLSEEWSRQYISSKSAFGATTTKKLLGLLAEHPVPDGEAVVVREAQRPNRKEGACRWCGQRMSVGAGHVVGHGADAQVEHFQDCPTKPAQTGQACALCGVNVISYQAAQYLVRDGSGRWETRHAPRMTPGGTCVQTPVLSAEEQIAQEAERTRARSAAARAESEAQQKKERAKAARAAARTKAKREAHDAEQVRVAGLATVERASTISFDKGLGDGRRARLLEHTDTLEDGTTTQRWTVETYYAGSTGPGADGDYDEGATDASVPFTDKDSARAHYQSLKFEPAPRRSYAGSGGGGHGSCAECGGRAGVVLRRDSSGVEGYVCNRCDRQSPDDYLLSFG